MWKEQANLNNAPPKFEAGVLTMRHLYSDKLM